MRAYLNITNKIVAALSALLIASHVSAAEDEILNPLDVVNQHFEAASKDFGDGMVQLHSRKEGAEGTEHLIYHFDCSEKKYGLAYEGADAPTSLPELPDEPLSHGFAADDAVAPLAQHTCRKHGYPGLEW
ncbi:hypothetical protein ROA7450_02471 [Roseovarius albus]|uniref:Uncharacterized protein n=1 Tax=Roseovarius albus TaxID=1247867 RepID=A0A1X6ZFA1_9RHOB|nr:hypothetical protein [Roseovarius albus]SLN50027.1 hypothetical protein ROA7450_02471 [Roseovarius albus]